VSNALKMHPTPWTVYDPNGDWASRHGGFGYRPIYIADANGETVVYLGKTTMPCLSIARLIVSAVNAKALARITYRPTLGRLSAKGQRKVTAIRKRLRSKK
jgi:hypothetical protein